jgi:hypothetical protein
MRGGTRWFRWISAVSVLVRVAAVRGDGRKRTETARESCERCLRGYRRGREVDGGWGSMRSVSGVVRAVCSKDKLVISPTLNFDCPQSTNHEELAESPQTRGWTRGFDARRGYRSVASEFSKWKGRERSGRITRPFYAALRSTPGSIR